MSYQQRVTFIGVPTDLAGNERGTALAPSIIKQSIDQWRACQWLDDLKLNPSLVESSVLTQLTDLFRRLSEKTCQYVQDQQPFITIGGDHSIALASWAGVSRALQEKGEPWGLIWVDAHLDVHTFETSHTDNIHGMPVAGLLGQDPVLMDMVNLSTPALKPEQVFYLGVRSYEYQEKQLVESLGCHVYDMSAIHSRGIDSIIAEISQKLSAQGIHKIGMSIDMDALDPDVASAVTVPEDDGMVLSQVLSLIHRLGKDFQMIGADLVEYCPHRDQGDQSLCCVRAMLKAIQFSMQGIVRLVND